MHHRLHIFHPPSILVQSTRSFPSSSPSLSLAIWPQPCKLSPDRSLQEAGDYLLCVCVAMLIHWGVNRLHLWKGLRTFFLLLGGLPLSADVSLDSGRGPPGLKKPVWLGGGENGGAPAPGGLWGGGPEGKKPPLAAMSFGGPPLKMRLKKSCKSAGLVGLAACSDGVLKVLTYRRLFVHYKFKRSKMKLV